MAFAPVPASGAVADIVAAEIRQTQAQSGEGARAGSIAVPLVLVYASATWCQPCLIFQDAVQQGALDQSFPVPLRLLKFDYDRDHERLATAGYAVDMLPYFAVPGVDGRATGMAYQGTRGGRSAVVDVKQGIRSMLAQAVAAAEK